MNRTIPDTNDQARLWNGPAGAAWIQSQALLERLFEPFETVLAQVAPRGARADVLDVGCGTGATTLAMARHLAEGSRVVGADISAPMIAMARHRAVQERTRARFIVADAQRHRFDPASFDAVVSRFGVMFFDDPVADFANLRVATRPGGALHGLTWRSAHDNPFMITAERAAAPLIDLPPRVPDGPGQFAFADPDRVQAWLAHAGWRDVTLQPVDVACVMSTDELSTYVRQLGPLGTRLAREDQATRERIVQAVRAAFDPFVQAGQVRFTAACWLVRARA